MEAARKLYPDGFGKLTGGTYTFPSGSLIASAFVLLEANYGWLEVGKGNPLTLQIDPEASIDTGAGRNFRRNAGIFQPSGHENR